MHQLHDTLPGAHACIVSNAGTWLHNHAVRANYEDVASQPPMAADWLAQSGSCTSTICTKALQRRLSNQLQTLLSMPMVQQSSKLHPTPSLKCKSWAPLTISHLHARHAWHLLSMGHTCSPVSVLVSLGPGIGLDRKIRRAL